MIFSTKTYRNQPKDKLLGMQFSSNQRPKMRILAASTVAAPTNPRVFPPPPLMAKTEEPGKKKMAWGEPTWLLFHTLAEKVKEEDFPFIRVELLNIIYSICSNLPCPICTKHATAYLNGINFNAIQTKQQLKHVLFVFHNEVNQRKFFSPFPYEQLDSTYSRANTGAIIHQFIHVFSDKNKNMKLIADDFIRTKIVQKLSEWFYTHIRHFSV